MHELILERPFTPLNLLAGVPYLCTDASTGSLLTFCGGKATYRENEDVFQNKGNKYLFMRPGGFGDLLFLTPTFREIKRLDPASRITVSSMPQYSSILQHNPDVDSVLSYPILTSSVSGLNVQWLENTIERNAGAEKVHAVDIYANSFFGEGYQLPDKTMKYVVTAEEINAARTRFPRTERRRVGVQVLASMKARNYPGEMMNELVIRLSRMGIEVFLFGAHGSIQGKPWQHVTNLTMEEPEISFRESMAILFDCDCVVGPDSVAVHVAGALDIPAIGLYGPFPWQLRTAYAKKTMCLTGSGACAPCLYHQVNPVEEFPEHGPCAKTGRCEVLAEIEPGRILSKVMAALGSVPAIRTALDSLALPLPEEPR